MIVLLPCLAFLCGVAHAQQAPSAQSTAAAQQNLEYEQQQRAKLNAMLSERAQEEDAAKQRREEANARTKQRLEARKKKAKKK